MLNSAYTVPAEELRREQVMSLYRLNRLNPFVSYLGPPPSLLNLRMER